MHINTDTFRWIVNPGEFLGRALEIIMTSYLPSWKYYCKKYLHINVSGQRVGDVWNKDVVRIGRGILFIKKISYVFGYYLHEFIIITIIIISAVEGKNEKEWLWTFCLHHLNWALLWTSNINIFRPPQINDFFSILRSFNGFQFSPYA